MTPLYYGDDEAYDVQLYDMVAIVVAEDFRFPAVVKKIHAKARELTVSFEGIDPTLERILLRKTARVSLSSIELVGRAG